MSVQPLTEQGLLDKIYNHEKLTLREERAVVRIGQREHRIEDVDKFVTGLRESSNYYRNKSVEELKEAVGDFQKMKVIEATLGLDKMFDTQLEAASRVAQANRIENAVAKSAAALALPVPIGRHGEELKNLIPKDTKQKHFDASKFAMPGSGWC